MRRIGSIGLLVVTGVVSLTAVEVPAAGTGKNGDDVAIVRCSPNFNTPPFPMFVSSYSGSEGASPPAMATSCADFLAHLRALGFRIVDTRADGTVDNVLYTLTRQP